MVKVATCIRKKSQVLTKNFWLFLYLVQFESNTVCYEIFKVRKGYFCFQFILLTDLKQLKSEVYFAYKYLELIKKCLERSLRLVTFGSAKPYIVIQGLSSKN